MPRLGAVLWHSIVLPAALFIQLPRDGQFFCRVPFSPGTVALLGRWAPWGRDMPLDSNSHPRRRRGQGWHDPDPHLYGDRPCLILTPAGPAGPKWTLPGPLWRSTKYRGHQGRPRPRFQPCRAGSSPLKVRANLFHAQTSRLFPPPFTLRSFRTVSSVRGREGARFFQRGRFAPALRHPERRPDRR